MTRDEVKELFKFLTYVYSNFEVSSEKLDVWTRLLRNQNAKRVMQRAERHALEHRFPPTIADLIERVTEAHKNDFLEKVKKWKEDAVDKPRS